MRIELPAAGSWAVTHRAQEDAHTLTVPTLRPPLLAAPPAPEDELLTLRVTAQVPQPLPLTLTF